MPSYCGKFCEWCKLHRKEIPCENTMDWHITHICEPCSNKRGFSAKTRKVIKNLSPQEIMAINESERPKLPVDEALGQSAIAAKEERR